MPYYHVTIYHEDSETKIPQRDYELDISEKDIKLLGEQYKRGLFFFKGKWIDVPNVGEIEIRRTSLKSTDYHPKLDTEVIFRGFQHRALVKVVTQQFIKHIEERPLSNKIFIVHGRDHEPLKELRAMLQGFGLNPIVLHEKASGSRTIIEKLEKHSDVGYTFVILTPDDLGALHSKFIKIRPELLIKRSLKSILDLKPRARQNVVLEFGYFIGLLGRDRVCCLHKGDVELPSDMKGIVYIPFKDSVNKVRNKIIKELKETGYEMKM